MKKAIITGAYGKIGKELAKGMARLNYHLLLLGRDEKKLLRAVEEINYEFPGCKCDSYVVDLSSKKEIFDLAISINDKIDTLLNNAATAPKKKETNHGGIEMQWATNVLGYYWMIMAFQNHLLKSVNPRVINVASYWAGGLDLKDPEFKYRTYNNDEAYRQSKHANRLMTYGLAELFNGKISINVCHPGDVNSKLSNDLGFGGSESPKKASETPLLLATTEVGIDNSGEYFEYGKKTNCRFKNQKSESAQLLDLFRHY